MDSEFWQFDHLGECPLLRLWWDADTRDIGLLIDNIWQASGRLRARLGEAEPVVVYLRSCVSVEMRRELSRMNLDCPSPMPYGPAEIEALEVADTEDGMCDCTVRFTESEWIRVICHEVRICRAQP